MFASRKGTQPETFSLWDRHKKNLYRYGHIYATMYGLMVINYIPSLPSNSWHHRLAQVYSLLLNVTLIIVLPIYFTWNANALLSTTDQSSELLSAVNFVNTTIKYLTVVMTCLANYVHYNAMRVITIERQRLEDAFDGVGGIMRSVRPRQQFERLLWFKFALLNAMMVVQVANIAFLARTGAAGVRVQYAVYAFILWNYAENMINYFYFINCSILRFYAGLDEHIVLLHREWRHFLHSHTRRQRGSVHGGLVMEQSNLLCDRLEADALRFAHIHRLAANGIRINQLQILGILLTTLLSNLTNLFTLFNMFFKPSAAAERHNNNKNSEDDGHWAVLFSVLYACIFYMDTSIVTLVGDLIGNAQRSIGLTLLSFNGLPLIDERLERTIEQFSLQCQQLRADMRICGFFNMDRRLTFLLAASGLTYFITLVQFDMSFYSKTTAK